MLRRTQTVYVSVDAFFSPRGKVLHRFEQFLETLGQQQVPCIWVTGWTRAQLDEPRRRLGQNDPFVGENGSGVYLPEDYFHLKGSQTIRLGRYTCIPIAKPQPAAAEALEELAEDMGGSVVPLRSLSQRELSQNTGLPGRDAEWLRMRDFDELFFFAGATEEEIEKFTLEARTRGLTLLRSGAFWSLSCGGNLAKCVQELGGLYDRAVRSHAKRIGVNPSEAETRGKEGDRPGADAFWPAKSFDRNIYIATKAPKTTTDKSESEENPDTEIQRDGSEAGVAGRASSSGNSHLWLGSPTLWEEVVTALQLR